MKYAIVILTMFVGMTLIICGDNQHISVNFESLFPISPFNTVLTTCMQLRNTLTVIQEHQGSVDDMQLLTDSLLGRMMHLDESIDIIQRNSEAVHADDIEYLLVIVDHMALQAQQVIAHRAHERLISVNKLVDSIKSKIEKIILSYTEQVAQ